MGLPSTKMEVGFFGSKYPRVVLVDSAAFRRSNDDCFSSVHCHFTPLQVSYRRGLVISAKFLMNLEQNAAELRRLRTSDTLVGGTTFWRASTFLGSGDMPFSENTWPKKSIVGTWNWHLGKFIVRPLSWSWRNTCLRCRSWVSLSAPPT